MWLWKAPPGITKKFPRKNPCQLTRILKPAFWLAGSQPIRSNVIKSLSSTWVFLSTSSPCRSDSRLHVHHDNYSQSLEICTLSRFVHIIDSWWILETYLPIFFKVASIWSTPMITQFQWGNSEGYNDGLVQERCNSSALAMECRLPCTNPSISSIHQ